MPGVRLLWHVCAGQGTTCRTWFCPLTVWVLGSQPGGQVVGIFLLSHLTSPYGVLSTIYWPRCWVCLGLQCLEASSLMSVGSIPGDAL